MGLGVFPPSPRLPRRHCVQMPKEIGIRVFMTEGISVSMDEIARRAGVGVGTVYSRPRKICLGPLLSATRRVLSKKQINCFTTTTRVKHSFIILQESYARGLQTRRSPMPLLAV
ncbi:TetR/AcrR family transcriptional regulator [Peribacillus sp. YIM B13482]|uniref:TetR/AcrR family transcriptional regulator n=1 Tax=Peribacillus sp. YIM B13482 TaxID=3366298 RepID=UPI003671B668